MTSKITQSAVSDSEVINPMHPDRPVWNPDVDNGLKLNTNPFEKFDYSGNSPPNDADAGGHLKVQDATVDTAPLQGSRDLSDEDHLGS